MVTHGKHWIGLTFMYPWLHLWRVILAWNHHESMQGLTHLYNLMHISFIQWCTFFFKLAVRLVNPSYIFVNFLLSLSSLNSPPACQSSLSSPSPLYSFLFNLFLFFLSHPCRQLWENFFYFDFDFFNLIFKFF